MKYVYLHGFLSGPHSSKGKFLAGKFKELGLHLHRPDLNDGDFEHTTISRQLQVVNKTIESLNDTIVLLGSSLGAYLAALAAERQKTVRRLILMAPAFEFADRYLAKMSAEVMSGWKKKGHLEVYHFQYQENRPLHFDIVTDAESYRKTAFERQLPVQIFHGTKDASVPFRLSIAYLENHPMADLILLNSDHSLLDKLDIMWGYIQQFLALPDNK